MLTTLYPALQAIKNYCYSNTTQTPLSKPVPEEPGLSPDEQDIDINSFQQLEGNSVKKEELEKVKRENAKLREALADKDHEFDLLNIDFNLYKMEKPENDTVQEKSSLLEKEKTRNEKLEYELKHKNEKLDELSERGAEQDNLLEKSAQESLQVNREVTKENKKLSRENAILEQANSNLTKEYTQQEEDRQVQQKLIAAYEPLISQLQMTVAAEQKKNQANIAAALGPVLKHTAKGIMTGVLITAGIGVLVAGAIVCPYLVVPITLFALKISLPFLIAGTASVLAGIGIGAHTFYKAKKVSTTPILDLNPSNMGISIQPEGLCGGS